MTIDWARLGMCRSLTVIVGRVPHQASCGMYGLVLLLCATSSDQFSFRWFGRSRFGPAEQCPDKRLGFYERHHALRRPGQGHTGLYNSMCQPATNPGARFGQATGGDGLAMPLIIIKYKGSQYRCVVTIAPTVQDSGHSASPTWITRHVGIACYYNRQQLSFNNRKKEVMSDANL